MYGQVRNIYEGAAYDPEKKPAPKAYWFRRKKLDEWYESRRQHA